MLLHSLSRSNLSFLETENKSEAVICVILLGHHSYFYVMVISKLTEIDHFK